MTGSKKKQIAGWVITVLVAALFCASATYKFVPNPKKDEEFSKMGFTPDLMFKIGILEVVLAVLYVVPWTSFWGAILLTGYLGGATVTHLRLGESIVFPIVLGVVMWVGLGLRRPEIFSLACCTSCAKTPPG